MRPFGRLLMRGLVVQRGGTIEGGGDACRSVGSVCLCGYFLEMIRYREMTRNFLE